MKCPKCGTEIGSNYTFCPDCGILIEQNTGKDIDVKDVIEDRVIYYQKRLRTIAKTMIGNSNGYMADFEKPQEMAAPRRTDNKSPVLDTVSQIKALPISHILKNVERDGIDKYALICTAASVISSLVCIRFQHGWLFLVASLLLTALIILRYGADNIVMVIPITVFSLGLLFDSIKGIFTYSLLVYFVYSNAGFWHNIQSTILFFIVVSYWIFQIITSGNRLFGMKILTCSLFGYIAVNAIMIILYSRSFMSFLHYFGYISFALTYIILMYRIIQKMDKKQMPNQQEMSYYNSNSQYSRLGGWLLFIVVIQYIGIVSGAIYLIISFISMIKNISDYSKLQTIYGNALSGSAIAPIIIGFIVQLVVSVVTIYTALTFVRKIRNKDSTFMLFYHKFIFLYALIAMFSSGFLGSLAGQLVVISGWSAMIIYTEYFKRSERVHVYMGTNRYLLLSPFTCRGTSKLFNKYI